MLHLALYHPAIPQNTGNIARTTVGMGAHLHLIHPMKFEILGNENTGLPDAWHQRWPDRGVVIPMPGPINGGANIRSYNLSNSAAIVLSQATLKTRP